MTKLSKAHEKLNAMDWSDILVYSKTSPTSIEWKHPTRKGKGGVDTKRVSMVAGGVSYQGFLVLQYQKTAYSIPKIVWVMHNGLIPEGYTIWFADGNNLNAKIENLILKEETSLLPEKYSESLKEYLKYDESSESGLRWIAKISKNSTQAVGDVAGSIDTSDGYWKIHGLGYHYKVHRLVWYMYNGKIPDGFMIDHINGNRSDNRIINLRLVTREGNARNRGKNKNNTSGHNMISYYEGYNHRGTLIQKYTAAISVTSYKRVNRAFSCIKYGKEKALELALQWRDKVLAEINAKGAGYTDRHGT